jgi:hypothetical protein
MHVSIVRTVARLPALFDARAKQPRLNVAANPYPPPRMLSVALCLVVLPLLPAGMTVPCRRAPANKSKNWRGQTVGCQQPLDEQKLCLRGVLFAALLQLHQITTKGMLLMDAHCCSWPTPENRSRNAFGRHAFSGSMRPSFVKKAFTPALEIAARP